MGRSALAGVGSCLQKGPALSDIHQFVRIAQIKSLNSNCVLVLMFHPRAGPLSVARMASVPNWLTFLVEKTALERMHLGKAGGE